MIMPGDLVRILSPMSRQFMGYGVVIRTYIRTHYHAFGEIGNPCEMEMLEILTSGGKMIMTEDDVQRVPPLDKKKFQRACKRRVILI